MLLFLDFDGVLHPEYVGTSVPEDVAFCHLPRFENIMRDFPSVEIVLSTTWRYQFSIEQLKARFSDDIRVRIIGITPLVQYEEGTYVQGKREGKILQWLAEAGRENDAWIVLDDRCWQFPNHRSHLIECISHVGLDDKAAESLRNWLISNL